MYRIEVTADAAATLVKVHDGSALASGGGQTVSIAAHEQVTFKGVTPLVYEVAALGAPDALDGWSQLRDQQVEDAAAADYVPSDLPGTQDLDSSGVWQQSPDYGYVWVPTTVVVGWVPYRYGHWLWVTPWGWTWVDDASWGYAPFHYGRWAQLSSGSWCWVPPSRGQRPVYAPALVAWVGAPEGAGTSGFAGYVGWFPLAPHEVYLPW